MFAAVPPGTVKTMEQAWTSSPLRTLDSVVRRRDRGRPFVAFLMALSCLAAAACSGEPEQSADAAKDSSDVSTVAGEQPAETVEGGVSTGDDPSPPGGSTPDAPDGSASGTVTPGKVASPSGGAPRSTRAADNRPPVPPFAPGDERIGITDKTIKLCTHINGQVTAALGASQEDARVFWRWLNDEGGVAGREVEMVIADDGDGTKVAEAYEECRGSFLIVGGPTQEAVPTFREIVENDPHPAPYLHFMAREDPTKRYSFSWYPSQERYGELAAKYILKRFPERRIGILRRDTDNWSPGYAAFLAELKRNGVEPVAVMKHPPKEQIFEPYLAELSAKKAEVVWAWQHALEHVPALKQAKARNHDFTWVLGFPLNLVSDTLRDDLFRPTVTGLNVFPTFRPGLYDSHHEAYEKEGRLFEAAYQRYRGKAADPLTADMLLRQWLDGRQLADLLERCGRDCTRTKVTTLLLNELTYSRPSCPFDFSLGRAAGRGVSAVEAYTPSNGPVSWRETAHCATSF